MKSKCHLMNVILAAVLFVAVSQPTKAEKWTPTKVMSKPGVINHRIATPRDGDFLNLIKQSTIWLDKSMLIKHILENGSNVTVISAPSGWGKTINLSMLKFYFQSSLNENGLPSDRTTSESYQYFVLGKISSNETIYEVGKPLISGYEDDYHLGRYPVIYLNGSVLDMEEGIDSIRRMIHDSYQLHKPFFEFLNNKSDEEKKSSLDIARNEFKNFFYRFFHWNLIKKVNNSLLEYSILGLCWLLSNSYNQKVIILFDNYDAYVQKAYFGSETKCDSGSEKAWQFIELFTSLMANTFRNNRYIKHNLHLYKAVFTSVLGIHENCIDDYEMRYHNVIVGFGYYFHSSAPFYGVVEPEFVKIAQILNWTNVQIQNITKYHGGYISLGLDVPIYPTFSIAACISNEKINEYWTLAHSQNFLPRMLKQTGFQNDIISLLQGFGRHQRFACVYVEGTQYIQTSCCKTVQKSLLLQSYDKMKVFAVLLLAGIVSIHPRTPEFTKYDADVYIPNLEIWYYLKDQLVVSLGLEKHQFSVAESFILHYANNLDDLNTLPSMIESISKSLFNHWSKVNSAFISKSCSECINENDPKLPIEVLLKLMFQSALQPDSTLLAYVNDQLIRRSRFEIYYPSEVNILPLMVRNCTVLSLDVRYCRQSDDLVTIQEAFNESLSHSSIFRAIDATQYHCYKFLAVCLNEGGKVEAMSLTLSSSDISKIIIEAEKKLDLDFDAVDPIKEEMKKPKPNDDVWKTNMIEQITKMYSSSVVHSFYDPEPGKQKKNIAIGGQKKVNKMYPGILRKIFKKPNTPAYVMWGPVELPKNKMSRKSKNNAPALPDPAVLCKTLKNPRTPML